MTEIVFDIDQTLADMNATYVQEYNQRLGLHLSRREMAEVAQIPVLLKSPAMVEYARRSVEADLQMRKVREEIRSSDSVQLALHELPGSVRGVKNLAQLGNVSYYTRRPQAVEQASKQWLANKGFPSAEQVVMCSTSADKLERIIADKLLPYEGKELPQVVIVDDSYQQLAFVAGVMVHKNPEMKKYMERIVLVGFGLQPEFEGAFYPESGLRTIALPSWNRRDVRHVRRAIENQAH